MDAATLFSALLMGIVEGITEFLPISSTGHLILLGELLGFQGPPGKTFEIVIQLGAILAVVVVFWPTLVSLVTKAWRPGPERFYAINLLLAFLPAAAIGATLHGTITRLLFSPWVVCFALIIGGIAIIAIERLRHTPTIHSVPQIGPLAALISEASFACMFRCSRPAPSGKRSRSQKITTFFPSWMSCAARATPARTFWLT